MAFTTYGSQLMVNTGTTESPVWAKVCPIKGIPQIGGEPNQLEITTNDDDTQTFIDGIKKQELMKFTINADKTERATIKTYCGTEKSFSIWLGTSGSQGKFTGTAKLSIYINSADVDAVVESTLTLTPTSVFEEDE